VDWLDCRAQASCRPSPAELFEEFEERLGLLDPISRVVRELRRPCAEGLTEHKRPQRSAVVHVPHVGHQLSERLCGIGVALLCQPGAPCPVIGFTGLPRLYR